MRRRLVDVPLVLYGDEFLENENKENKMILSGSEIKRQINKKIFIEPFDESRINPNSYNLSLADELLVYENDTLDMKLENPVQRIVIPQEGILLEPDRLYLGRTAEFTRTEGYVPCWRAEVPQGGWGCLSMLRRALEMWDLRGIGRLRYSAYSPYGYTRAHRSARYIITLSRATAP